MTTRRTVLLAGAGLLALNAARPARADCRSSLLTQDSAAAACTVLRLAADTSRGRRQGLTVSLGRLRSLPQAIIRTALPANFQTAGSVSWQGPTLGSLLELLDLPCEQGVYAKSLNGYGALLPRKDLLDYAPILAWLRNGKPMSVRGNGPLMVIYPFDSHAILRQDVRYLQRTVWQVQSLTMV